MKRRLSAREVILLGLLLALALAGGYMLLFYTPMTSELERLTNEKTACEEQIEPALLKIEDKKRMKRELEEIFAQNPEPVGLAPYDNQKPVMMELNSVLRSTNNYSLSFSTVESESEDGIVRRRVSLSFSSNSYAMAKEVLQKLHDSAYRCMVDDLSVSIGEGAEGIEGAVSVNMTIVFFEYKEIVKNSEDVQN